MSVYNVFEKNVSVPQVGKLKLEQLLTYKKFGKIYIMLGINELGYNQEKTLKKYKDLLKFIQEKQSNAIIYIEANLHVAAERSNKDKTINNININKINNEISKLADKEKIFFIDVNEKFDDENGKVMKKSEKQIKNLAYRARNSLKEILIKEEFDYEKQ